MESHGLAVTYDDIVRFHGHECPGLAMGYRMACAAMGALRSMRAEDEELVAVVENDACGVDALQCATGCTFGKGNLIFRDYGKQVYTLFSRSSHQGVRVVYHGKGQPEGLRDDRPARARWILNAPQDDVLSVTRVSVDEPEPATIHNSVTCAFCGERVMETRIRNLGDKPACIPCAQSQIKPQ